MSAVHRLYPFAIRLVDRHASGCTLQPMRLSLDPGSKTTGLALARIEQPLPGPPDEDCGPVMHIAFLMDLVHRGQVIRDGLARRSMLRRSRRGRKSGDGYGYMQVQPQANTQEKTREAGRAVA